MSGQRRSWQEVFGQLLNDAKLSRLAERIGSRLPIPDFRRQIADAVRNTVALAVSNQRPWQGQKRGLMEVAKRAKKAAAAVRKLDEAFDDRRWVHSRQQLMEATGWTGPDLPALAAELVPHCIN